MLLLADARLDDRRRAASGPLRPLAASLMAELEPLLGKPLYIPEAKALLSRAGGRCELDGTPLDFDPMSPNAHRCPTCGTIHTGELHHRAWITSYQLWLAERAVHGALFHLLAGDPRHAAFAAEVLRAYGDAYQRYPNQDNVLGPTRLFFSTYLESIWLLQICLAADMLERSGDRETADLVRARVVEPSSALIARYDEGMSNRQVWNNAALMASASLLGDDAQFERAASGPSGLEAHLTHALLADGTWYEGENYHLFALRGLWYAATLCDARGRDLPRALRTRLQRAFTTPFATALPDFTMPSRKDSQYAVSLRQWRIAELTELGYARTADSLLAAALARCYEPGHERRDTGRARSTADVERNGPSSGLTRADLGWRALLHAVPELPATAPIALRSVLLQEQGIAVFRRAGEVYVALDFGQSGGGHGHPDRLNLILSQGNTRWLDDLGTGSYVDPSLHWYRSTLAHNAPLVNGRSQPLRAGALRAYDERDGLGWIAAELELPDDSVRLQRTVLVAPDYVLDELRWSADREVRIELPVHLDADAAGLPLAPASIDGGQGLEDGFSHVRDVRSSLIPARSPIELAARRDHHALRATLVSDTDCTLFALCGPGQPAAMTRRFYLLRAVGSQGTFRTLLAWSPDVHTLQLSQDAVTVELSNGERHVHRRDAGGWHVELFAGGARSGIDLSGWRPAPDRRQAPVVAVRAPVIVRRASLPDVHWTELSTSQRTGLATYELGEAHYRRSEDEWALAGSPRATIALGADAAHLLLFAHVRAGERHFASGDALNPLDNEHADTMAAGLQLYVRTPEGSGAWMLIPEADSEAVRVRSIAGWGVMAPPGARWRATDDGYEIRALVSLPTPNATEYPVDVDVIVNETTAPRLRRRGQLVMSGAHGEFVYLRGDRHDPSRLVPLVLVS